MQIKSIKEDVPCATKKCFIIMVSKVRNGEFEDTRIKMVHSPPAGKKRRRLGIGDMRIRDSKEKTQQKQYVKLDSSYIESRKPSKKDLQKAYVNLDDTLNGAKYLNKKAAKYAEDALAEIDRQLSRNDGSYDAKKINDLIDKAMMAIDDELGKG